MRDGELIGRHLSEVPTPALILLPDVLEQNIRTLQDITDKAKITSRPHAKGHKCLEIARRQLAGGAAGICCQKLSEAEVFITAGIGNVLLTNEIIDDAKLAHACRLAKTCQLRLVVDSVAGIERLEAAAQRAGMQMEVLVELNVGQNRCGAPTVSHAVALAIRIESSRHLTLKGLQAYHGKLQHVIGWQERRSATLEAMRKLSDAIGAFSTKGLCLDVVTGGGTGTVEVDCELGLLNEVQAGSYAVMDMQYREIGSRSGSDFDLFRQAIFVTTQVISRTDDDWCVVDAGLKALSNDAGHPEVEGLDSGVFSFAGDEHGVIDLRRLNRKPTIGDRLHITPGHCDTTINLHDRYLVIDDERVVDVWMVDARGRIT